MAKSTRQRPKQHQSPQPRQGNLYTLEVTLASGPLSKAFVRENPIVARTVHIFGQQTLEELHRAIFRAFGRQDDQMYEFQLRPEPTDPTSKRYVLPGAVDMVIEGVVPPAGDVTQTTLDTLGLKPGQTFAYWFDFVADWWHQIRIARIEKKIPVGKYPKVTKRVGANPPQQADDLAAPVGNPQGISGDAAADMSCLIGEMHLRKADYPKAVEAFSRAIEVRPTADAFLGRAKAYRALASRDENAARELS